MVEVKTSDRPVPADVDSVIVREYPKVIFLYPSVITAAICACFATVYPPGAAPPVGPDVAAPANPASVLGAIFMTVFIFNLLVLSFDFGSMVAFAITTLIVALGLLAHIVNQHFVFLPALARFMRGIDIQLSFHFYVIYVVALCLIYLAVYIIRRFYYWEIRHNEVLHHNGLWGDVERHPTIGLKQTKEINDVFEFLLWRSGRLTLQVRDREAPYVLENVPNINRVESLIQQVTSRMAVEIEPTR
jgi:hypothetical protein